MHLPAPLAVAVEIRSLGKPTAERPARVWRTSLGVGEPGIRFGHDLPYEAGRPVAVTFRLPDDTTDFTADGVVETVAGGQEEEPRPRAVRFTSIDQAALDRLLLYIDERMQSP